MKDKICHSIYLSLFLSLPHLFLYFNLSFTRFKYPISIYSSLSLSLTLYIISYKSLHASCLFAKLKPVVITPTLYYPPDQTSFLSSIHPSILLSPHILFPLYQSHLPVTFLPPSHLFDVTPIDTNWMWEQALTLVSKWTDFLALIAVRRLVELHKFKVVYGST